MGKPFRRGTFLRLDHGFLDDPAHLDLSRDALLLHVCGLLHASKHLTDGVLPKAPRQVARWAPHFVADQVDLDPIAAELVDAGVWEDWPDHWLIVGFLKWNNSKAQVDEWRERERNRKKDAETNAGKENPTPDVQITDTPPGTGAESRTPSARKNNVTELRRRLNPGGAA